MCLTFESQGMQILSPTFDQVLKFESHIWSGYSNLSPTFDQGTQIWVPSLIRVLKFEPHVWSGYSNLSPTFDQGTQIWVPSLIRVLKFESHVWSGYSNLSPWFWQGYVLTNYFESLSRLVYFCPNFRANIAREQKEKNSTNFHPSWFNIPGLN